MITKPCQERSVIDEIRDEIQLDNYYRKFESNRKYKDCDSYNDSQSDNDFAFESFYE